MTEHLALWGHRRHSYGLLPDGMRDLSDAETRTRIREAVHEVRGNLFRQARANGAGVVHALLYAWAGARPTRGRRVG